MWVVSNVRYVGDERSCSKPIRVIVRPNSKISDCYHKTLLKFYQPSTISNGGSPDSSGFDIDSDIYEKDTVILWVDKMGFPSNEAAINFKLKMSENYDFDLEDIQESTEEWDMAMYMPGLD